MMAFWLLTHVQMLYFHSTSEEMQKLAAYTAKSFQLLEASHQASWPGALSLNPAGAKPPDPPPAYSRMPAVSRQT